MCQGDESMVAITYEQLPKSVKPGQRILIQDTIRWRRRSVGICCMLFLPGRHGYSGGH